MKGNSYSGFCVNDVMQMHPGVTVLVFEYPLVALWLVETFLRHFEDSGAFNEFLSLRLSIAPMPNRCPRI
jgi:hypothetical protein